MTENEKISTFRVIDDFLPQKQFEEIQEIIMNDDKCIANQQSIGWNITTTVAHIEEQENWKYFYMTHMVHDGERIDSLLVYKNIIPILKKLKVKALIRIKCNMYPNSETVHEHDEHIDFDFTHNGAIFYINTCNGYTKLIDGTKIESVANRMLIFDPSIPHCSTTTNDTFARFNINFNYF